MIATLKQELPSLIRQKSAQNGRNKKAKHNKFSEKTNTFYPPMRKRTLLPTLTVSSNKCLIQ